MRQHLKSLPIPIVASPALITPIQGVLGVILLPVNRFPNKLGLNVPNNMLRNLFFFYLYLRKSTFFTTFINKPDSSKDLTIHDIIHFFV